MHKNKFIFAILALLLAAFFTQVTLNAGKKQLTVTFLDVGEGQCVVLRTPGGKIMVVDCGTSSWRKRSDVGSKLAVSYLQTLGVNSIDVAVLSHPHSDHMSGMSKLLKSKPAKLVLDLGIKTHASKEYLNFLKAVKKSGAVYKMAKQGQNFSMGNGVEVKVLHPDPKIRYEDLNENSIVLRVSYKQVSFMLTADAGIEAEKDIIYSCKNLQSTVLQVGHHGSTDSTSDEWLNAVNPKIAVISCGYRNQYGHPSRNTLEKLKYHGTRYFRTDYDGAIQVSTDGAAVSVKTFKQRQYYKKTNKRNPLHNSSKNIFINSHN